MNKIIVILGPTGVGKTKLSTSLAKELNGEIINADSTQFYKDLKIGTAKIKEEEKEGIPHHLFDICDIDDDYTIYHYQQDARRVIDEIQKKNKTPIMVGGTGLYVKAALYDYKLNKEHNANQYEDYTTLELYQMLVSKVKDIDIDKNNRQRIVRALNYYEETGKSISDNKTDKLLYDAIFIGLTCDRALLYDRINSRVDKMIEEGLIQEVRAFYKQDLRTKPLVNAIGYKELYKYFDNEITLEEAINLIKKNTRHYAKRQYTFFNHQLPVKWFNVNFDNFKETINEVIKYINTLD